MARTSQVLLRSSRRVLHWVVPVTFVFAVIAVLTFAGEYIADPDRAFALGEVGSIQFVLNTNAAALTSAMSVLIALVLLSVQLTAQRYSFNVIGMFIQDRVNAILLALFIITILFNLWIGLTLRTDYIPGVPVLFAMIATTVCFALLPAYIVYLFDIVRPDHILNQIQADFFRAIRPTDRRGAIVERRTRAARRIGQIGDIARTAISLTDSAVARHSVWVLYGSIARYVDAKGRLPVHWFDVEEVQFRGRHELIVREIEETNTWVERRMLDELREVFFATLNRMHDVNNTVALVLRLLGEKAVERNDSGVFKAVTKFFNTFLRAAINQGDVRAGYHVLYQYRLLADTAMDRRPELTLEIAQRLSYYGDAAASGPLLWMSAAAAYDLRSLAESADGRGADSDVICRIIGHLVETVRRGEAKQSPALPQLYKMVVALGGYFTARDAWDVAHLLRAELASVPTPVLDRVCRDLLEVEDPVFWELTDRVVNFDYVDAAVRAAIPRFLSLEPTVPATRGASLPAGSASAEMHAGSGANGALTPEAAPLSPT
ncbi:MAG: DUF2254 domain-containing protein [Chloroflexi bacterium]|nr:DUF2254 domain-containing protein [Chloroflexota bacterium]